MIKGLNEDDECKHKDKTNILIYVNMQSKLRHTRTFI